MCHTNTIDRSAWYTLFVHDFTLHGKNPGAMFPISSPRDLTPEYEIRVAAAVRRGNLLSRVSTPQNMPMWAHLTGWLALLLGR